MNITKIKNIIFLGSMLCVILSVASCTIYDSVALQKELGVKLVDSLASKETVILFHSLKALSQKEIIFGHQNSTEYGVLWKGDSLRSDVRDVTGSFPGLYGWDFESIPRTDSEKISHRVPRLVREAYARGGINTFSWHMNNPVTGRWFYDTTVAVKYILPGGKYFHQYLRVLDTLADYCRQLVDERGRPIPIIFRPFHEFDGSWFWWGKHFCTSKEFIKLWQITVEYLRSYKKIRNFLYAFSPDRYFWDENGYLERYPGDGYVDIIGMDDYTDFKLGEDTSQWVQRKLKIITAIAEKKQKIAAFTETGSELIPDSAWWTHTLYAALDNDSVRIAYVMVWRNAHKKHFFAPYPGHPSAKDFIEFRKKPKMIFEDDLPDMYRTVAITDLFARLRERIAQRRGAMNQ
jgi:mannan endo-1,4-beta-mannosidase